MNMERCKKIHGFPWCHVGQLYSTCRCLDECTCWSKLWHILVTVLLNFPQLKDSTVTAIMNSYWIAFPQYQIILQLSVYTDIMQCIFVLHRIGIWYRSRKWVSSILHGLHIMHIQPKVNPLQSWNLCSCGILICNCRTLCNYMWNPLQSQNPERSWNPLQSQQLWNPLQHTKLNIK